MPAIGKIYGIVADSITRKPIDYATITLIRLKDSSIVSGAVSSSKGDFLLENLPMGRYKLLVTMVGYKKKEIGPVMIFPNQTEFNAGTIYLSTSSRQIKEVEVTADKSVSLNTIDKRVFEVGKNLISTGGTATEVLQSVPGVTVDIDGNVSLRGNANVTVLIDGKPSTLSGSSRAAILQQLPAGSIERIEVITNPGAKYDADGMSGIINIITKKDKMKGFNLNASVGAGTHDKYNASLGLNYRTRKFNFYTNYNFRSEARYGWGHSERKNSYADTVYFSNNDSKSLNHSLSHVGKAGMDWYINSQNTLGVSAMVNVRQEKGQNNINYFFLDGAEVPYFKTYRQNTSTDSNVSVDATLDYKHIFKDPKKELTASATYSTSARNSDAGYVNYNRNISTNELTNVFLDQKNVSGTQFNVLLFQADYSNPIGESQKFETGIKSTNRFNTTLYDASTRNLVSHQYENDTLLTRHYSTSEQIHAAYFQYTGKWKEFTYQAGLRGELAVISGKSLLSPETFHFSYPGFYPSGLVKYTYRKSNDFQVSYSRRVNRPEARSLLPFTEYEDLLNVRVGNPALKPENINSFEASYYKTLAKHTLGASVYYRHTVNMITRMRTLDTATGVTTMMNRNFSSSDNTGIELITKSTLFKMLQFTTNINLYQNTVNGSNVDATLQSSAFNWNARGMLSGRVSKAFTFQFSGFYMAPTRQPQGTFQGMSGIDGGCKYEFWKGNASVTANVSDILNSRHFEMTNFGYGFTSDNYRKRETRIGMITFNYRFGSNNENQRSKRNRQDQNNQNDNRMDDFRP